MAVALAGRPLLFATVTTTASISPLFLVGAQAVQIGADLRLSPATLGNAVALFFGLTALSSATLGRLVERAGVRVSLVATMVVSCASLAGVAAAQSVVHLALALAVGGLANGAVHPSTNKLLSAESARVPLGLSMGVKQSAPALAGLLAGLAVPAVALTVGWRWSFLAAAVPTFLLVFAAARVAPQEPREARPVRGGGIAGPRLLVVVAVGAGCGGAAGNSLGTFLVDYGANGAGVAEGAAGLTLAVASGMGLLGRIGAGMLMDRPRGPGPVPLTVGLLIAGTVGHLLVGTGNTVAYVAGAIVAYGLGWAWSGLLHYAVVVGHPAGAARATGVLMTGFASGGFLGPLVLGHVAHAVGYQVLWVTTAVLSAVSAVLLWCVHRIAESERGSGHGVVAP
ncbi:MAG: MFS transporter [Streptosporangiales bacterium]|nr:MFS transporter [Streptosporangiales bacterium]